MMRSYLKGGQQMKAVASLTTWASSYEGDAYKAKISNIECGDPV